MILDGNSVYQPPYSFSEIPQKDVDSRFGKGKNVIPAEYLGVLPGIPGPLVAQPAPRQFRGNETDSQANSLGEIDSDSELNEWIQEYMELVRRTKQSYHTEAPQTEAQATPAGEGGSRTTAAVPGSLVGVGMPEPTS